MHGSNLFSILGEKQQEGHLDQHNLMLAQKREREKDVVRIILNFKGTYEKRDFPKVMNTCSIFDQTKNILLVIIAMQICFTENLMERSPTKMTH